MPESQRITLSAVTFRPRSLAAAAVMALAVILWLGLAPARPADFEAQHAAAEARNPTDLHFTLVLAGGRTEFHLGELIPVEYALSSYTPEKYKSGDIWHDGSNRSRFEAFYSDRPADSADPLEGHWAIWETLYTAHYTGRTGSWKKITQTPIIERWDLNEYLRFDRPGKYRIYATTRHVVTDWSPGHDAFVGGPPLTSNLLELEILAPDLEWADEQVQHATEALVLAQRNEQLRISVAKTIRYLQTSAALDAMASRYTGESFELDRELLNGLIGYHDRAAAVKRMEQQLAASDFGVSRWFLFSLGVMKLRLTSPELNGEALAKAEKPEQKHWRHALFDVLMPYFSQLSAAAEKKTPRARALTLDTLFISLATARFDFEPFPISSDQVESLRLRELASLPDLPPYEQLDRISNFGWAKTLPHEQVLPVLRKVYEHPAAELSGSVQQTRKYVLKDVAEISPEESQKLLAEAITEPVPSRRPADLAALPVTPSPELDAMLIARLEGRKTEEMRSAAPLIGKSASPAILERVRAVYEVEKEAWPCTIEAGLLAYFLRVDPAYGEEMLPAGLTYVASRSQRATCGRPSLIGAISELVYPCAVEKAAIAQLDDPGVIAVEDAIQVLRTHATDQGLAALLDRFRRFHDEWKDYDPKNPDSDRHQRWDSHGQASLELALVRALSQSAEYRRKSDRLEELAKCCIADACRAETQRMAK